MIFSRTAPSVQNAVNTLDDLVNVMEINSLSGEIVTPENSKTVATAYRCANIISDDVAKMPLQTFQSRRSGEIERVRPNGLLTNIAWRLEVQPNRYTSPFLFKKQVVQWMLFHGNAYIWQAPNASRELFILPASSTEPIFDKNGNLWYKVQSGGNCKYYPDVEVLHLMINPDSTGMIGQSVIQFAREVIGRQKGAHKTQSKFYKQGLNPSGVMFMNGALSAEERNRVRASFEQTMSGSDNAYRLAVLDNKVAKFEPITMKPTDVQFLEQMQATDAEIANFFGLPLHKLNMGKQSYESNTQQQLDYLATTIDPYLVQWEELARLRWVNTAEQGYTYFRFERKSLLRTDPKAQAEQLGIELRTGQITHNEARQVQDRPAFENGDKLYFENGLSVIGETKR